MGSAPHTIPILPADLDASTPCAPAGGCGGCVRSASDGPVCRSVLGEPCAAPTLTGPADELARLLKALEPVLGTSEISGLVRALTVGDGEVELLLTLGADCGGAALADSAFQVLRGLLPDTDIYVVPAR